MKYVVVLCCLLASYAVISMLFAAFKRKPSNSKQKLDSSEGGE